MAKGPQVPAPAHRRSLAKGLRTQPVPYKWGLVEPGFVKRGGHRYWKSLERGRRDLCLDSIPQTFLLCLGLFFLLLHLGPCPKQQWGCPHLQEVLVWKHQTFPHGEAPVCCHPSCSRWLQQERAMLRTTGAQAIVLLPTTAARRCRRCRAKFYTNLG